MKMLGLTKGFAAEIDTPAFGEQRSTTSRPTNT